MKQNINGQSLKILNPNLLKWNLHVCFFFHPSVGKTSLLHQYIHKRFYEDYRTTLGASILSKVMEVDHTPLKLQVTEVFNVSDFLIPCSPNIYSSVKCTAKKGQILWNIFICLYCCWQQISKRDQSLWHYRKKIMLV